MYSLVGSSGSCPVVVCSYNSGAGLLYTRKIAYSIIN